MLQRMNRIQVVGPRKELNRVVDLLYNAGTVHLEDANRQVSASEIDLSPVRIEAAGSIAEVLGKIQAIFSTLPSQKRQEEEQERFRAGLDAKNYEEVISRSHEVIHELETTTRELTARKSELTLLNTALERYAKVLSIIQPVEKEIPALEGFEVTILLIQKEHAEVIELIKKEIATITHNHFEMISTSVDEETLASIMVFSKKYDEEIHGFIYSVNVNEVRLPKEYTGRPFYEMFALIEEQKEKNTREITAINTRLAGLSSVWYQELTVLQDYLRDIHDEVGSYANFGVSAYTFVIMGWIPARHLAATRKALGEIFGGRVVIIEPNAGEEEMKRAPVWYDNPSWVKPFEFIMKLAATPKYREVDPSPVLAVFFPIFFGLMVGDIGYGLVILTFAFLIRKRFAEVPFAVSLGGILMISAIPTIVFGYLYGEFFGDLGERMGWLHPFEILGITWNRAEAIIPMLILAIAIGVIHVFLGLSLGIRNAIILKNRHHLAERAGMVLAISAIILALVAAAGALPEGVMYGAAGLMVFGLPLILYGAGPFGAIEIMSTVGNILSYARLMAIGMASVILAIVANELGGALGIAAVGVVVAVLLHTLNIILAMFSPSIHSIRLHLVEFFSKFYEGGGVPYRPFARAGAAGPEIVGVKGEK